MSEAKTVAIIGAGPVGLAAAAHVLERGLTPIVLEAGAPGRATPCGNGGHVQLFSPWEYNIDKAAARLLADDRLEFSRARPVPDRRGDGGALSRAARQPMPRSSPTSAPRAASPASAATGFDKAENQGPRSGAVRNPLPERQRPETRQGRRGHRRIRHLALAESGGRQRPSRDRREKRPRDRIAYGMPDVLGSDRARYAGKTVAVLGAGHSGDRHADRPGEARGRNPGTRPIWLLRGNDPAKAFGGGANDKLAAPRRTGRRLRRAGDGRPGQARKRISRLAPHRRRFAPRRGRPRGLLRPASVSRRRTYRGDRLSAGPRLRARVAASSSIRRSNARSRWRR